MEIYEYIIGIKDLLVYICDLNYSVLVSLWAGLVYLIKSICTLVENVESSVKFFFEFCYLLFNLICSKSEKFFNYMEQKRLTQNELLTEFVEFLLKIDLIENFIPLVCLFLFVIFLIFVYYYKKRIRELEMSNSILKESRIIYSCCICKEENSTILFWPCKHLCCCSGCYNLLKENSLNYSITSCPLCRCQIQNEFRIYA